MRSGTIKSVYRTVNAVYALIESGDHWINYREKVGPGKCRSIFPGDSVVFAARTTPYGIVATSLNKQSML